MSDRRSRRNLAVVRGERRSPLAALVDEYLEHDPTWRKRTKDQYSYNLRRVFLPWCEERGIDRVDGLTARRLTSFHRELAEKFQPSTVHSYLRSLNQFLTWAREEGEEAPAKAQLPRLKRHQLEVLSREEVNRLEAAADSERDKLLIRLMADCGLRLNEVLGLRVGDLRRDGRSRLLRVVQAKGGDQRLVPVPPALWERLRRHAERGRPADYDGSRVFVTRRRHAGGNYSALEPRTVQNMVASAAEQAGIGRRVHPHLLRHSYATNALNRRMNPVALQRIMGHADMTMISEVYSHLTGADLYDAAMRTLDEDED